MSIWWYITTELNTYNIRFLEFRKLLRGPAFVGHDCICLHQGTPEWRYWRRNQALRVSTCLFFDGTPQVTQVRETRCNDKENDRMGYDTILSERALREIYLMPFMLAQKYAKPWSIMTS